MALDSPCWRSRRPRAALLYQPQAVTQELLAGIGETVPPVVLGVIEHPGHELEHVPTRHRFAAGVLAPGPGAADDLAGGLVPGEALEHERTADAVPAQPHRLGALLDPDSGVDRESAVAPGQQVVDDLSGDLSARDEQSQHLPQ